MTYSGPAVPVIGMQVFMAYICCMRWLFVIVVLVIGSTAHAQTVLPPTFAAYTGMSSFAGAFPRTDSSGRKPWSFSRFSAVSTSFSMFNGGTATTVAVPVGFQLNRRLTDNLYAFANIAAAPAYTSFNRAFIAADPTKTNPYGMYRANGMAMYTSATLGLMYVSDDRSFSISGGISVQRNNLPVPYYPMPVAPQRTAPAVNRY